MRRKLLIIAGLFLVFVASGLWLCRRPPDLPFHGKPESQWIANLKYWDDEQAKEWRTYGKDGVRVLVRGMERANHPFERMYRNFYIRSFVPGFAYRFLPAPTNSAYSTRMCILSLLEQLGTNADIAMPVVEKALDDEGDGVVQIALSFFNDTEDQNARLNRISKADRARLLPKFIRCVSSHDDGVRNNAIGSLYCYPDQKDKVAPVLVHALADSDARVQIRAAETLQHVAPDIFKSSGAIRVPIQILKHPDDQIAHRGARLLRECNDQPDLALPALIEALRNTNELVACQAVWALDNFKDHSAVILLPLREAAQRKDKAAGWAQSAVKNLEKIEAKRKS